MPLGHPLARKCVSRRAESAGPPSDEPGACRRVPAVAAPRRPRLRAFAATLGLAAASAGCTDLGPTAADPAVAPRSGPALAVGGVQEGLFTPVDTGTVADLDVRGRVRALRGRLGVRGVRLARLATAPGSLLQAGRAVAFDLGGGRRVVAVGDRVGRHAADVTSWHGVVQGDPAGDVELVAGTRGVAATVRTGGAIYAIQPAGGGLHTIVDADPSQLPPEAEPGPTPPPDDQTEPDPYGPPPNDAPRDNGGPYQKVLVVYTQSVVNYIGDAPYLAQLAVNETNTAYANSQVGTTLLLAGTAQVNYNDYYRPSLDAVNNLRNFDAVIDEVHTLRDQVRADLVVMLTIGTTDACGRASVVKATATTAFAVVRADCIYLGNLTFAHEIGHLQGAWHDRLEGTTNVAYSDGYGYVDPNGQWRTIMSSSTTACGGCPRVKYFSNPNVIYPGTNTPMGRVGLDNNARVLNETRTLIRDFRTYSAPYELAVLSPYGTSSNVHLRWRGVGADYYDVYRCVSSGGYSQGCSYTYPTYLTSGPTYYEAYDYYGSTPYGYFSPPCGSYRTADYRVVASGVDGVSPPSGTVYTCIR